MKSLKYITTALIALSPAILSAEELTFNQCLEMAMEYNQKVKSADYYSCAAKYEQNAARAHFFPNISLTGSVLYSSIDGKLSTDEFNLPVLNGTGQYTGDIVHVPSLGFDYKFGWIYGGGIKLEQPIFMGGKIIAGYKIAKSANLLYAQNKRLTEAEVIVETATAYANLMRATEIREVAFSYKTLLDELQNDVNKAYKHGLKPKNDVLKVQVKLNEAILNLRKAENACKLASMNLCHYIGHNLSDSITVNVNSIDSENNSPVSYDFSERPENIILKHKTDIANQKVNVARSEYIPQIGLVGEYGYMNGINFANKKLLNSSNFMVGVQVSVPLYDFGYRINKIKVAKAQLAATKAEQEDTEQLLALGLNQAINNLDEANLEVELAKSSVASADENLRSSIKQYQAGLETLTDNLEAQTIWQQAHTTLVEAKANRFLKNIEYLRASGRLN